jgi:hypothetical protein
MWQSFGRRVCATFVRDEVDITEVRAVERV